MNRQNAPKATMAYDPINSPDPRPIRRFPLTKSAIEKAINFVMVCIFIAAAMLVLCVDWIQ